MFKRRRRLHNGPRLMDSATKVQNLNEAVCISRNANISGKAMNPIIPSPTVPPSTI